MRVAVLLLLGLLSAGCARVNYETTRAGRFKGEVAVVWLRGTEGSGDGTFIYVPTPGNPMTFTRPEGETLGKTITPPMMTRTADRFPGLPAPSGASLRGTTVPLISCMTGSSWPANA